jgi:4-hydroxy-2-oxoheptanedioate aldolase
MILQDDPFQGPNGAPRVLRGVSVLTNSTRLAELAGNVGFEVVWIDVEHGTPGFVEVEALCTSCEVGGAYPLVRIPDNNRFHVLRALEAGARILMVPMVNSAEDARKIVEYGMFPPLGKRGYNTRSRGLGYGLLKPAPRTFERANRRTLLFAQIETLEGVRNVEAICAVKGISGILVGPGDLSADLGIPGEFANPKLIEVVTNCIKTAKAAKLHPAILVTPGPLLDAALQAGADMIIAGCDISDMATVWEPLLEKLPSQVA